MIVALAVALAGCGGSAGPQNSSISGRVVDENGRPVRGATVTASGVTTTSSPNGTFALNAVREEDLVVRASLNQNGTVYRGQNVARTVANAQAISFTILMAPEDTLGRLEGVVRDRAGDVLEGASVFALGAGALNSARAITDRNGHYLLSGLVGGYVYDLNVGGGGYASSTDQISIRERETLVADFTLGDAGFPTFPTPQNLSAIAWTSPPTGRDPAAAAAYEHLKQLIDPKRATRAKTSRLTPNGSLIEIELEWDEIRNPNLLGYEIFRGASGSTLRSYDFYREPQAAVYIDTDQGLLPFVAYRYSVSAVGTRWPDDPNGAGPISDVIEVETMGDLELDGVSFSPLTFYWLNGSQAERYVVYLFGQYPGYNVDAQWKTEATPSTTLFQTYSGPANLVSGQTYYYLVLGLSNGSASRSLSRIGSFVYRD